MYIQAASAGIIFVFDTVNWIQKKLIIKQEKESTTPDEKLL